MTPDLASLTARAERMAAGRRRLLGITGPPGAGKSTLAAALVGACRPPGSVVVVPMDGWHLRRPDLARLGRTGRKGAPDTFDVTGFVALLRRLRGADDAVRAPAFDRGADEVVDDAIEVAATARLVVVEGNYLLLGEDGWAPVRALLDEVWYLETEHPVRRERLVARHVDGGRHPHDAAGFVASSDEVNAAVVEATRWRADLVVSP